MKRSDKPKFDFINYNESLAKKRRNSHNYYPSICDEMIEYFSVEPFTLEKRSSFNKYGQETITYVETPNKTPYFMNFAIEKGVHKDTLNEWARTFPEFNEAYRICRELQRNFLIENALRGNFNATAYKFTAVNLTEMREKIEIESNNTNTVKMSQEDKRSIADKQRKIAQKMRDDLKSE